MRNIKRVAALFLGLALMCGLLVGCEIVPNETEPASIQPPTTTTKETTKATTAETKTKETTTEEETKNFYVLCEGCTFCYEGGDWLTDGFVPEGTLITVYPDTSDSNSGVWGGDLESGGGLVYGYAVEVFIWEDSFFQWRPYIEEEVAEPTVDARKYVNQSVKDLIPNSDFWPYVLLYDDGDFLICDDYNGEYVTISGTYSYNEDYQRYELVPSYIPACVTSIGYGDRIIFDVEGPGAIFLRTNLYVSTNGNTFAKQ